MNKCVWPDIITPQEIDRQWTALAERRLKNLTNSDNVYSKYPNPRELRKMLKITRADMYLFMTAKHLVMYSGQDGTFRFNEVVDSLRAACNKFTHSTYR